jgi:hypothetical protein
MIRCQARIALNAGCPKKLDVFDGWRSKVSKNTGHGNMPQYRQPYDDFGADQVLNSS